MPGSGVLVSKNELLVGHPRLCRLIDGDPETPETEVMVEDTGSAIIVTFSIAGLAERGDGPYDRWWSQGVMFGDDPDRKKYSYNPPSVLLVYDVDGTIALVGCRARGASSRSISAGKGVLIADFAILGARTLKYESVNAVRTESYAYRKWVEGSAIEIRREGDNVEQLRSMTLNLKHPDSIRVSRTLNMSACGTWSITPVLGGYDVRESLFFETSVSRPRNLLEHIRMHIGVLDLVSVAAWRNCTVESMYVMRKDDPLRVLDGTSIGEQWLELVTHQLPGDDVTDCEGRFLFSYSDMAPGSIERWLRLKRNYGRALDYLLNILRSGHTWSPQSAIMSGIALEQLGYLLAVNRGDGVALNSRRQISFKSALDLVIGDMQTLPFDRSDVEDWKERCRNVYMSAKHADRDEVDHLTMLNTLRENLLVLRYWIAQRLGVNGEVLTSRLRLDPLRSGFTRA